jgi:hypothetical protein
VIVAAVVPWRGGQPDREGHHAAVRAHLRQLLPRAVHLDADSGHLTFSRAGARNCGVLLAKSRLADVVVICDADTLVEPGPLHEAIADADDGRLHLPYTRYRGLSETATETFHRSPGAVLTGLDTEQETDWATGGVLVIQPDAWWRAGGMDERHAGWGFEDTSFRVAADALLGPTVRHEGVIHHLWHPTSRVRDSTYGASRALADRYDAAQGNPDAVRALVAEHRPYLIPQP